MSDLISRADALTILSWYTQTDPLGHTPCQLVEALPSADAVQVVRCKDCKFNNRCLLQHFVRDNAVDEITDEWFCADGRRSE